MTSYTKTTDFESKDALLTGNPSKTIKGQEIDDEFDALQAADADNVKISGLAAGVNTFLTTPSSANLAAAVTDETGSGALVFATSPTLAGTPLAPTAASDTNTTQIATTAHVFAERTNTATLTNKTLTSPVINTGDINTPDIDGGTIDGTVIGGSAAAAGTFTTLNTTNAADFSTTVTVGTQLRLRDSASVARSVLDLTTDNLIIQTGTTTGSRKISFYTEGVEQANVDAAGALNALNGFTVAGNTTLGDASTDTVTVNGYMGVGAAPAASTGVFLASSALSGTTQVGFLSAPVGTSGATSAIRGFSAQPGTAAAAFTVADLMGFVARNPVLGAGSAITNAYGLLVEDQTRGTNNYGITSLVSSGANKWNIYASGTAANYFAGRVGIGGLETSSQGYLSVLGSSGAASGILVSDVDTNSTAKDARLKGRHYTNSEEPVTMVRMRSDATDNTLSFGGSSSVENSTTIISFYTSANNTTVTGTERMRIDSSGKLLHNSTTTTSDSSVRYLQAGTSGAYSLYWRSASNIGGGFVGADSESLVLGTASGTLGSEVYTVRGRFNTNGFGVGVIPTTRNNTSLQIVDGIGFPATQVASSDANTLDDYEEGTFTPTIVGTSTAGVGTYSIQTGKYTKIGRTINFDISLEWSAHTGIGNMRISGLPFTSGAAVYVNIAGNNLTFAGQLTAFVGNGVPTADVYSFASGGSLTAVALDTSAGIRVAGHYEV